MDIKRILVYTHNSIGLGHLYRTSAVITGIQRWRPDLDFLVLTGSSLPQVLLEAGIEVVKLPGIKQEIEQEAPKYRPRHLSGVDIESLIAFRRKVIEETFNFFKPDAVMVEHRLAGLMGEASVLLQKKKDSLGRADEFALIHLSRGIMGTKEIQPIIVLEGVKRNILNLYDFLYILEDASVAAAWRELRDSSDRMYKKIRFIGRTVIKTRAELSPRNQVLKRLGLSDRPILLVTLGRSGAVVQLFQKINSAFERAGLLQDCQTVLVIDPYLDLENAKKLMEAASVHNTAVFPFIPNLVDLINISELMVCRAGYNTVNEVLMTGVKAMIIPEHHPSEEQEIRARGLQGNVVVTPEKDVIEGRVDEALISLINRKPTTCPYIFDKYDIGRRMIEDLEFWAASR